MGRRMNGDTRLIAFFRQLLDLSHLDPGCDPLPLVERALALMLEATRVDHAFLELSCEPPFRHGAARGRPFDPETFTSSLVRRLIDAVITEQRSVVTTTARTTILCVPIPAPTELELRSHPQPPGIGVIYAQTFGHSEGVRDCLEALAREVRTHAAALTGQPQSLEADTRRRRNDRVAAAIKSANGNVAAAARMLRVPRSNLYEWIDDLHSR